MRKEITKEKWKLMIWGLMGIGIILNALGYLFLFKGIELTQDKFFWLGIMSFGILLLGIGVGFAYSRAYKIGNYD